MVVLCSYDRPCSLPIPSPSSGTQPHPARPPPTSPPPAVRLLNNQSKEWKYVNGDFFFFHFSTTETKPGWRKHPPSPERGTLQLCGALPWEECRSIVCVFFFFFPKKIRLHTWWSTCLQYLSDCGNMTCYKTLIIFPRAVSLKHDNPCWVSREGWINECINDLANDWR